jgi:hypothetical protein
MKRLKKNKYLRLLKKKIIHTVSRRGRAAAAPPPPSFVAGACTFCTFLHVATAELCGKKAMRKAVKQAPVVQSVAASTGGGSRALITVTRQIQEVRQEYDRMQTAKEPLWFSMPEPVDHNPLHFRYRHHLSFNQC